jgi:hypothetical protein
MNHVGARTTPATRGAKKPTIARQSEVDPRKLELRPDGKGAGCTRTFAEEKQRCRAGTCRFDHGEHLCYADPRQRIQLSFVMKPGTFKKIQEQREENAQ